jgi:uncharacterized membrane-anchored protein
MSRLKWIIIFVNFLLLLVYFNCSVLNKEKILSDGKLILLELAPVDPRSLMQGDYMRLNYAITSGQSSYGDIAKTGYCVVELDSLGVGRLKRFQPDRKGLAKGEYLIEYNLNGWDMNIGAESYFFQEGNAEVFEEAKYGGVRVDGNGNSVLVGLYDKNRKLIEAPIQKN